MRESAGKKTKRNRGGGPRTVIVAGRMTIDRAAEIQQGLLAAFAGAEGVCLDVTQVTEVDLTGLQLICSSHRTSLRDRKSFLVNGCDSGVIRDAAQVAGFLRHVGCVQDMQKTCIWTGGA